MIDIRILVTNGVEVDVEGFLDLEAWDLNDYKREAEKVASEIADEEGWDLDDVSFEIDSLSTFDDNTIREIVEKIFKVVDCETSWNDNDFHKVVLTDSDTIVDDVIQEAVEQYIKTGITPDFGLERIIEHDTDHNGEQYCSLVAYK